MTKTARKLRGSYECQRDWPENCFVQCGGSGVVFGPNGNYRTAFFEAFPKDKQVKTVRDQEHLDARSAQDPFIRAVAELVRMNRQGLLPLDPNSREPRD